MSAGNVVLKGMIPMNEEDTIVKALREVGPRYIANSQQQLVGFLLTPEEYEDYLEMLEDRADSQDEDLARRLMQAAIAPAAERPTLRDYLRRRPPTDVALQS